MVDFRFTAKSHHPLPEHKTDLLKVGFIISYPHPGDQLKPGPRRSLSCLLPTILSLLFLNPRNQRIGETSREKHRRGILLAENADVNTASFRQRL